MKDLDSGLDDLIGLSMRHQSAVKRMGREMQMWRIDGEKFDLVSDMVSKEFILEDFLLVADKQQHPRIVVLITALDYIPMTLCGKCGPKCQGIHAATSSSSSNLKFKDMLEWISPGSSQGLR